MQDANGNDHSEKRGIVEVSASFHEKLYACHPGGVFEEQSLPAACGGPNAERVSIDELVQALRKMKTGKATYASGITAEMLKKGGCALHDAILDLFNDVLALGTSPPEAGERTRLKVIFQKGRFQAAEKLTSDCHSANFV